MHVSITQILASIIHVLYSSTHFLGERNILMDGLISPCSTGLRSLQGRYPAPPIHLTKKLL